VAISFIGGGNHPYLVSCDIKREGLQCKNKQKHFFKRTIFTFKLELCMVKLPNALSAT
jgi:hypothetical protein